MRMNILRSIQVAMLFFVFGCNSRKSDDMGLYELTLSHAEISMQALNALSEGNEERAAYLLRVDVFVTTGSLPKVERELAVPSQCQSGGRNLARKDLSYLEKNVGTIIPNTSMIRQCIQGIEEVLTSTDEQERIQRIKKVLLVEKNVGSRG